MQSLLKEDMTDLLYQILRKYLHNVKGHFVKYVKEVCVIGAENIVDVHRFIFNVIMIINNYIIYDILYMIDIHDK